MYQKYGKRLMDMLFSVIALIILSVPMLIIAVAIKLTSPGPVFFRHQRYGKDKKPFTINKFRTMSIKAPKNMPTNSFSNASSFITPFGAILRKLSLDELPQLFNVLLGDMSVIGPRPVILAEKSLIALRDKHDANSLKPGITGWAQVNGRDELDNIDKATLDGEYANSVSPKTDIKIFLKTIAIVLKRTGNREGSEQESIGINNASK